jgi:hypothetical protein
MRVSAETGSEKITRSRVTGELHQFVDRAQFGDAGAARRAARVAAIVEHSNDAHVRIALRRKRTDQGLAVLICANHHRAAVEPAFAGPAPHQEEQPAPERDQGEQPKHIEHAEPDARELIAGFGEKRHADGNEKDHGPGRCEPHVLLLVTAERLHLIDVGHLEG